MDSMIGVFRLAVTVFVPMVVWTLLLAGLYQLLRDRILQVRMHLRWPPRLRQKGFSQRIG
jgi:hypothetical protein